MIIAIDFDGTCVTHDYPEIGKDIGATPILQELVKNGHHLILWTMRGNKPVENRNTLQEAVDWFQENNIPLWGINENPEQTSVGWTNSKKQYATLYIDDAALGCPLKEDLSLSDRPFVDWDKIRIYLNSKGILNDRTNK